MELIPVLGSQPTGDRSHKPGGRLPLLSAKAAVTSPATEHHRPLAGTKLHCFVTEAHVCKH